MNSNILNLFIIFFTIKCSLCENNEDELVKNVEIYGPGLKPDLIVMPARYFFVQFRECNATGYDAIKEERLKVVIRGQNQDGLQCRMWHNVLNIRNGTFIVRYKLIEDVCSNLVINVAYNGRDIGQSPYHIQGTVVPDDCDCPEEDIDEWLDDYECKRNSKQMTFDLARFQSVDFDSFYDRAVKRFNNSYSSSVCHYVVKSNEIYRSCYGQHVDFKMFMDAILSSLARKVRLPDFEFFSNLGDWPLMKLTEPNLFPIFSWCGSKQTADIVMPTYQLTEAALECMGRVTLDMLSVQGNTRKQWPLKADKLFWRGRDSSRERLKLIDISREHPDLIDAALTNFFFFRDQEHKYGPKVKHVSFFDFFEHKYQLSLDGTVAAFRFPFLLAGDSLVLKQDSVYYEHFYSDLKPWMHYVPVKTDLSDLVSTLEWAKSNDEEARKIARHAQLYARNNLLPREVFCYHAVLFNEWSKKLVSHVKVRDGMTHVKEQRGKKCECHVKTKKDEL